MIRIQTKRYVDFSPLRYPGGKSSLTDFFSKLIAANFDSKPTYVEPYAGGAGAALALLLMGRVERIVVNDLDPAIWAMWNSIVNEPKRFQTKLRETPVTLEQWHKQKKIYAGGLADNDPLALGFATFFLNRTNRSGVLNAGVIGGQRQSGTYRIDARYNKPTLLHRLERIAAVREKIDVRREDGIKIIEEFAPSDSTFIYADPPYFVKGSFLYLNSFDQAQHERLAGLLNAAPQARWLLTYDDVTDIRDLYSERRSQTFSLHYSAHKPGEARELMVFSDALVLDD